MVMENSILIDGKETPIKLPTNLSLSTTIGVVERALFKRNSRIGSVSCENRDIFDPHSFNMQWADFKEINCTTKPIQNPLKKAIVTLTIGNKHDSMRKISHPTMQAFAKKVGADFIVINEIKLHLKSLLLEKWQMFELLFDYDRIMFVDTDLIITPTCPDLFDMVPMDMVAAFAESDYANREHWVKDIQEELGDIGWSGEYLNSGVVVYSYIHKPIFDRTKPYVIPGDQHTFNHRIKQNGFKVYQLPYKFNHMELCQENRFESYVVHYAGSGFTGIPCSETDRLFKAKVELMQMDAEKLKFAYG